MDWNRTIVQLWYVVYLLFFLSPSLPFYTFSSFLIPSPYPYSYFTIICNHQFITCIIAGNGAHAPYVLRIGRLTRPRLMF
ncbi:hypothetical protein R3P38DRAFT_2905801 [Favolaschia claudopus]|uniref:Secreted protein n=1 Tax=Favolaschia claudopus TaxID=2862362 RepID=A0AAW0CHR9_9AGAR